MRRIVFVIVGLFAIFTMIRAYANSRQTASGEREENRIEEVNYADVGNPAGKPAENL